MTFDRKFICDFTVLTEKENLINSHQSDIDPNCTGNQESQAFN